MTTKVSRRVALAGFVAMAPIATVTTFAAIPPASTIDPVFAVIEEHKAAFAALLGVRRRTAKYQAAAMREKAALLELLNTLPTTPRGASAALQYMGHNLASHGDPRTVLHDLHVRHGAEKFGGEPDIAAVDTYLARLGEATAGYACYGVR